MADTHTDSLYDFVSSELPPLMGGSLEFLINNTVDGVQPCRVAFSRGDNSTDLHICYAPVDNIHGNFTHTATISGRVGVCLVIRHKGRTFRYPQAVRDEHYVTYGDTINVMSDFPTWRMSDATLTALQLLGHRTETLFPEDAYEA